MSTWVTDPAAFRRALRVAGACALILGSLMACADRSQFSSRESRHTAKSAETAGRSPEFVDSGSLSETLNYPRVSLTLAPPPAGTLASISPSLAFAHCSKDASCPDGVGPPTAFLAKATADFRSRVDANGDLVRTIDGTLVYVFRWNHVPCQPSGPALGPTGEQTNAAGERTCLWLTMINATTGDSLGTTRITDPLPR